MPGWSVCVSVCPQWELSQKGLFAFLSGSGIEFQCSVMELSLFHIPHPSPVVGSGTNPGLCLQVGRAAIRLEKAKADTAKHRMWLSHYKNPESVSVLFS